MSVGVHVRFVVLLAALGIGTTSTALAQNTIAQAEEAYLNVDFERTLELCQQALAEGRHAPDRVARIYELMGVANAANGDEEAARESYVRMLALAPDAQVDTNLAPRLRSPFMEARGVWATRSERLGAEARLVRQRGGLRVVVTDPLGMGVQVRVLSRVEGEMVALNEQMFEPSESLLVPIDALPEADRIEYVVQLLDEHGNRLVELGTEDEPRSVGRERSTAPVGETDEGSKIPLWVWGIVGGAVAAAGIGLGLYFGLRTEPVTLRSGVTFQ